MIASICVYCGSSTGAAPAYAETARAFGRLLAAERITLVYGGGKVGLMGIIADAAMSAGGRVVGVIPQLLLTKEVGHHGLSELHVVDDMHQRKKMMADLSDAFVAMPGGVGTFEELFEVYTWAQLGYHSKPLGLLNIRAYYEPLLAMLAHTVNEGFMQRAYVDMLQVDDTPLALLAKLRAYRAPNGDKWSQRRDAV